MTTVFYSWQMDTPTDIGRNFIGTALELAIDMLNSDAGVEEASRGVSLDSDTQGVSGSPPIVETISGRLIWRRRSSPTSHLWASASAESHPSGMPH